MASKSRDLKVLSTSQYKTVGNLQARWNLYEHTVPSMDLYGCALKELGLNGGESILEVGCGDGSVLLRLREQFKHTGKLVGLEINDTIVSPTKEYLAKHPVLKSVDFKVGTAEVLPMQESSVDIILAFFMLYHMPDIQLTLKEWKRVLAPHGKLVISTSSKDNRPKAKTMQLKMAKIAQVNLPVAKFNEPFNLENAQKQLERVFKVRTGFIYEGQIRVADPEIYLKSFDSRRDMYDPVPSDTAWVAAREWAKREIQAEIDALGFFSDNAKRGYFICE